MLTPDPAFDALRRQAKLLAKAQDAATAARRDVRILEQASNDAWAAHHDISRGQNPRCDPTRILVDADRETSRDVRLRLALPSGTSALVKAARAKELIAKAEALAQPRADRLERASRGFEADFEADALEFVQNNPIASAAFAAALTLNGIAARDDRFGETTQRFKSWILGAGVELEEAKP